MQRNPLIIPILDYLKQADSAVSILDVVSELDNEDIFRSLSELSFDMMSFRKNFLVMNALYSLQRDLVQDGYWLSVSVMSIHLKSVSETASSTELMEPTDEKLSAYYLDWENYHQTGQAEVEQLLKDFWQRYSALDKCKSALELLGLDDAASWEQVQLRYRRLVSQCHPDKGGEQQQFIKIREAYEILACCFAA